MKKFLPHILLLCALASPAAVRAADVVALGEYELDMDLVRAITKGTIVDQIEIPDASDWAEFSQFIEDALHAESIEDLAAAYPGVQRALSYLQTIPEAKPYQAWLRQRQDYCDVARQTQILFPAAGAKPSKKSAPPKGKIRLAPVKQPVITLPAQVIQKRRAYLRSQTTWDKKLHGRLAPEGMESLMPVLKSAFKAEGVAPEWAWLAEVESSLNPQARSPVGAAGLFQFMPATAKRYGLSLTPLDERAVPLKSAHAAAKCLRELYGRFGSWPLALAAYNAGDGRVGRLLEKKNAKTFDQIADALSVETQMYVPKVCATIKLREGVEAPELPPPKKS
ncbi:MAG: lytic transglycosylase domain-containing protein [Kiritimatiellaeota bacterium]|nr:lytic transglycosylase domain-containing protein [Kiritimatiellota bacterium]